MCFCIIIFRPSKRVIKFFENTHLVCRLTGLTYVSSRYECKRSLRLNTDTVYWYLNVSTEQRVLISASFFVMEDYKSWGLNWGCVCVSAVWCCSCVRLGTSGRGSQRWRSSWTLWDLWLMWLQTTESEYTGKHEGCSKDVIERRVFWKREGLKLTF